VHFGLDRQQRVERARRFLEHAATGVVEPVLGQVADGQGGRLEHGAAVGFVESRHHPEQGRLARAVGSAQADALAIGDLPRHVIEQDAVAEALGEI
jgi:hypothetical protein